MSRCGCSSAGSCQCYLSGTCLGFSGAGTEGDPYLVSPIFSPAEGNQITCEEDGLLVPGASPVRVSKSGTQAIANDTVTPVQFDTEQFDAGGTHDNVTLNTRLTAVVAGVYWIFGHLFWAPDADGTREATLRLNGATIIAANQTPVSSGTFFARHMVGTLWDLAVNDYVELLAYHSSGGVLDLGGGVSQTHFGMHWAG